ncbi:23S rRNA (uracil-C(5))-methyltransferase RlmCD [Andreesenia angusta]|uniref:23S rRNA (Uracil-C(5))-methyltransferase RlmCD n=1 Tax=Andreesenia angusta TaxID=39480 RepID=A0A1S1V664_9FIRM|nr:23S rRNA (uracil(1939)-C(5))-methyltransferase RlmD [Andreesenia angusta]OHW62042.1 23S rRNA (uracil-C(5))-methyltransferase RlmCD [Andreesenia angusta]
MINLDKGSKVKLKIVDMTHEGKGVGRTEEGLAVFVDRALVGDTVEAEITKMKKNYAEAKMVEIVEYSKDRIESRCPVSERCGGCELQELKYEKQLEMKEKKVKDALSKLAKVDVEVESIISAEKTENYRNKVNLHIENGDEIKIGYYERGSHSVVDTDSCNINSEVSRKVADLVKDWLEENHIDCVRHIVVRDSKQTGDTMVVIVTAAKKMPMIELLSDLLVEEIPEVKTVVQNINTAGGSSILGPKSRVVYGEGYIYDYVGEHKFKISPETFFQVNTDGMELLYSKVMEYAALDGSECVYDIYCGIGTITLMLAEKAKTVYGVEYVEKSVANAIENAELNNISNVEFYAGKAESVMPDLYRDGRKADVVVIDPPRKGCEKKVLEILVKVEPKKVVYVSCNPSTMARDIAFLVENGYSVQKVQPVDMFPMSSHVEAVALLTK